MAGRSVILLATNKNEYLQFALNCAASVRLHNPDLPVYIATNVPYVKALSGIHFLPVSEEIAKLNIEAKLYINNFLQTEETLFIDSDCLCFDSLNPIFEACKGRDVSVIGRLTALENYWGTGEKGAAFARKEFAIDQSILFNGGFYYFKKTPLTKQIFDRAREISARYDEYGFHRIKNKWKNEEDMLSIGMIANKQLPIKDDGTFMTDLSTDQRPNLLNVLKGTRLLRNYTPQFNKPRNWYPPTYAPIVLHFGGSNIKSYPYISQSVLLNLHRAGVPIFLASLIVNVRFNYPYKLYHFLRTLFTRANHS